MRAIINFSMWTFYDYVWKTHLESIHLLGRDPWKKFYTEERPECKPMFHNWDNIWYINKYLHINNLEKS